MYFLGTPQGISLIEASNMYEEFGTKLFTQSAFWGVSNLVLGRAYYDTNMFEDLLKKFVGEMPMIQTNRNVKCPKVSQVCGWNLILFSEMSYVRIFQILDSIRIYSHESKFYNAICVPELRFTV